MLAAIHWREWLVAGGTIGASLATAVLAFVTWRLVTATKAIAIGSAGELAETRRQAELAAAAFSLQIEPHIVAVEDGHPRPLGEVNIGSPEKERWAQPFEIPIANAGSGLTIIERVEVHRSDAGAGEVEYNAYVRAGELSVLRALWLLPPRGNTSRPPADIDRGQTVTVRAHYRGIDDRRYQEAFAWTRTATGWQLRIIDTVGDHVKQLPGQK
jgi:hypothetical protein